MNGRDADGIDLADAEQEVGAQLVGVAGPLPRPRFARPAVVGRRPRLRRRAPVLDRTQKLVLAAGALVLVAAWSRSALVTAVVVNALLIVLFTASNLLKLVLVWRSLASRAAPCRSTPSWFRCTTRAQSWLSSSRRSAGSTTRHTVST